MPDPQFFEGLANAKTIVLNNEDHDVFGDGTVVIKFAPGHTPGHQVAVSQARQDRERVAVGRSLSLSGGDHAQEAFPTFDTNKEQTAKSRAAIEDFVKANHAQLWIQHDYTTGIKRKMAPEFYD